MIKRTKRAPKKLSVQVENKIKNNKKKEKVEGYDGTNTMISTGSTLLDLAISGGRNKTGGIPTGIFVEIFGPSGAGKTVLLCQLAGNVQKMQGKVMFHDPEARLDKQFAKMFGLQTAEIKYSTPDTVPQVFSSIRDWLPKEKDDNIYGVFADSLAALSTDMEMGKDGDKMGMRRAKEFSEELRKTCRVITNTGALVVCSNQVRQSMEMYGPRYKSPGGEAIGFYSSLRLRCSRAEKIKTKRSIKGKDHERIVGVKTTVEVFKSSVWKPFRTADIYIIYDYGIDDIRANLQFLKTVTGDTVYMIGDEKLDRSLNKAIQIVEEDEMEKELKKETIAMWNEIEEKFSEERKPRI